MGRFIADPTGRAYVTKRFKKFSFLLQDRRKNFVNKKI